MRDSLPILFKLVFFNTVGIASEFQSAQIGTLGIGAIFQPCVCDLTQVRKLRLPVWALAVMWSVAARVGKWRAAGLAWP